MAASSASGVVKAAPPSFFPLALIDRCIGCRVLILMRSQKEITGVLRGFDDFVNMVLDDVTEYTWEPSADGKSLEARVEQREAILLNGSNVAILVPCGEAPDPKLYHNINGE
eukprot:Gregarina_sp_Pseudo_9__5173@NODE_556_length_2587_cov_18_504317_g525_i0_p3_GENE_NODE_556_length_2587_cov_18_504317_g525_i0NODE_556_length_2587_cov_18_504317_g525_i0_p3_ORF_typecomplete_len112_score31_77LSM/PF01423_22/1_7e15SMATX/PF14438_6/0_0098DUF150_C/PF17384_2/0_11DUF150_C/PF17384_2/1_6e03_NODE_556_length_2587_cov_18_504317_g525_i022112546